ncbi:Cytokinin riboside 5'-monophosphate phosphoribohydrolase log7 [Castilleja foliolosa]|uniref:cytokinin riboside 5'-monophosphate phosphoribohydrolase n=1 Tax=Castilleja foliolosa TaxID=1961234 RepID=A0ABD3DLL1_9LAMI
MVGLLNVEGFYDTLLSFLDKAVDEGFISPIARRIFVSAPTAKQLVRELEEHIPKYDDFTSNLKWEEVERINYMPESDVPT